MTTSIKQPYDNKLSKRRSSKGEHVSDAVVIGMANLCGVTLRLKIGKRSERNLTSLKVEIVETSLTMGVDFKKVPELVEWTKPNSKYTRRNLDDSIKAYYINLLIHHIQTANPEIHIQHRKPKETKVTLKHQKLAAIGPFEGELFEEFGEGVIEILERIARGEIEGNVLSWDKRGRGKEIKLESNNQQICQLYTTLAQPKELGTLGITDTGTERNDVQIPTCQLGNELVNPPVISTASHISPTTSLMATDTQSSGNHQFAPFQQMEMGNYQETMQFSEQPYQCQQMIYSVQPNNTPCLLGVIPISDEQQLQQLQLFYPQVQLFSLDQNGLWNPCCYQPQQQPITYHFGGGGTLPFNPPQPNQTNSMITHIDM